MSKSKKRNILVGVVASILFVAGCFYYYIQSQTPETLTEKAFYAARLGGDYLVRHQLENGRYEYRYNPENDEVLSGYNMLRHAGTTYALFELYSATEKEKYRAAGERALQYLRSKIAACPPPRAELVCVYDGDKVKLGGNALAVLALVEHARVTGSDAALELAQALARWVVAVQTNEGEFSIHIQLRDGAVDDHVSEYYPGEAIYALMRLYEETGEKEWLNAATSATRWIIEVRDAGKTKVTIAHDHWLLYGLRELFEHVPAELYIEHAKKIIDGIVALQYREGVAPEWVGGYYNPPRSTPTATRSEGLAAAYTLFQKAGEGEYADKAYAALERGVQFELRTFIDGRTARTYPAPTRALGGFRASLEDAEVRIDYVQHNISALLAYSRLFVTRGE